MNFQVTIIFVAILGLESAWTDDAGELVNGASNWGGSRQYSRGSGISRSRRSPPRAMMSSGWGMKKAEPVRAAPPPTHPPPPPPPHPMPMSSGWGMAKSAPEHPPPPPPPPPPMKMSGGWPQPMAWMEMKMGGSNEHGFSASW